MLSLPFRFVVTFNVRSAELLDFGQAEWSRLEALGLETIDPPGEHVAAAGEVMQLNRKLSFEDSLNYVVARENHHSILLTGDRALRKVAEQNGVEVHGILWVVEKLLEHKNVDRAALVAALECWHRDPTVFLPEQLLKAALEKCK